MCGERNFYAQLFNWNRILPFFYSLYQPLQYFYRFVCSEDFSPLILRTKVLTTNWLLTDKFQAFPCFIKEISEDAHDCAFSDFDVGV